MKSTLKIATWNLERPWRNGRFRRAALQLEQIQSIGADIWVLTETWAGLRIPGYRCVSTPSSLGPYDVSESAVAIWVPEAWSLRGLETTTTTLCAEVVTSAGESPLLVYGTIITWHGAPGAKHWVKHLAEVNRQTADWVRLRGEYPDHLLIVAGDFNMTLPSDKGYGRPEGRRQVRERLNTAGVACATGIDVRDPSHGGLSRDNIDHICVDKRVETVGAPVAFAGSNAAGQRLSDHNGMVVAISIKPLRKESSHEAGRETVNAREIVLRIGAEGGSITLYGTRTDTGWLFSREVIDQTSELLDETAIEHHSGLVSSWPAALDLLSDYPWMHLHPLTLHPEFKGAIFAAAIEPSKKHGKISQRQFEKWQQKCTVADRGALGQSPAR